MSTIPFSEDIEIEPVLSNVLKRLGRLEKRVGDYVNIIDSLHKDITKLETLLHKYGRPFSIEDEEYFQDKETYRAGLQFENEIEKRWMESDMREEVLIRKDALKK